MALVLGALSAGSGALAELPWTTTTLAAPLPPAGQYPGGVWVSPDGKIAVYGVADEADASLYRELRCLALDGEVEPVLLTSGLAGSYRYHEPVVFSPDSRRLAFVASVPVGGDTADEVWSAPLCGTGAAPVRLSPSGPPGPLSQVLLLLFTPNSQRVLFASDHQEVQIYRIYSAPAAGGETVELGGTRGLEFNQFVYFVPSVDGQSVVLSRRNEAEVVDLVSVPVGGPASAETILVHGTLAGAPYPVFWWTPPVTERLVYASKDESAGARFELYSAPLAGPADQQVKLSPTLTPGHDLLTFILAPDGSRVAYSGDLVTDGALELFSVPIAGPSSASVRLNRPLPPGSPGLFAWAGLQYFFLADSSRIIYSAAQDVADRYDIYSVPASGPGTSGVRLNEGDPSGGHYFDDFATPDSKFVFFTHFDTPGTGTTNGNLHVRRADGTGVQLNFCTDPLAGAPVAGSSGLFAVCSDGGSERQLHHWQLSDSPVAALHTDVTPIDDSNTGFKPFIYGPTAAEGGVLFVYDWPSTGSFELFAADRRILLSGFESGTTAAWSVTVP